MTTHAGNSLAQGSTIALCRWFPPSHGGIERYLEGLYRSIASPAVVVAPGPSDRADGTRAGGHVVRTSGVISSQSKLVALDMGASAWRLASSTQPSQVHCGHVLMAPIAYALRARFGLPFLVFTHGSEVASERYARFRGASLRVADMVVTVSAATRELVLGHGVDSQKIRMVHPAVDSDLFRPDVEARKRLRRRLGFEDEVVVLAAGRLHPNATHKGFDTAIKALAKLENCMCEIRLVIAGEGPDRGRLERLSQSAGVARRVVFTGRLSDEELRGMYRMADIFTLPSRVQRTPTGFTTEGFGIVFLEAAASGLPVVATKLGGARDAVADGRTGTLLDQPDVDALATELERLSLNAAERAAFGQAGRERAVKEFSWEASGAALDGVIAELEDLRRVTHQAR